jgi:multidrug efflux pump subunit AcrA (membrane-fusion protein)
MVKLQLFLSGNCARSAFQGALRFNVRNLVVALSIGILPFALSGCETGQSHPIAAPTLAQEVTKNGDQVIDLTSDAQKLVGMQYGHTEHKILDLAVKCNGEVLADANLMRHVTTPVTGRVEEVLVRTGDHIAEGKPLLNIRSTDIEQMESDLLQNEGQVRADLKRDLLQIDSDLATIQEGLKLSESTFNRLKSLVEEKIASQADFEAARTALEKDRINLASLKRKRDATVSLSSERMRLITEPMKQKLRLLGVSAVDLAKLLRTRQIEPVVQVLAPESGIISDRLVNVGELVDPSKPLFTIGDFHDVWLKADVYEQDVSKVREGQPIELEVDSFPGHKFAGRLNFVADSLTPENRTLAVRAEVPNPGLMLKPKMFARMHILIGEHKVLTIPKSAVQDAGTEKVVYLPLTPGKFEERQVKLGVESGAFVEVLSGLRPGDKVVTVGSFDLRAESLRASG